MASCGGGEASPTPMLKEPVNNFINKGSTSSCDCQSIALVTDLTGSASQRNIPPLQVPGDLEELVNALVNNQCGQLMVSVIVENSDLSTPATLRLDPAKVPVRPITPTPDAYANQAEYLKALHVYNEALPRYTEQMQVYQAVVDRKVETFYQEVQQLLTYSYAKLGSDVHGSLNKAYISHQSAPKGVEQYITLVASDGIHNRTHGPNEMASLLETGDMDITYIWAFASSEAQVNKLTWVEKYHPHPMTDLKSAVEFILTDCNEEVL